MPQIQPPPASVVTRRRLILGMSSALVAPHTVAAELQPLKLYTEEWPPVSFASSGGPDGFAVQLVSLLQRRTGQAGMIQVVPFARGFQAVQQEPNVVYFTLGWTPEREQQLHLLGPVLTVDTWLWGWRGRAPAKPLSIMQAKQLKLVTGRQTVNEALLQRLGFESLQKVASPSQAIRMLQAGRVDLWCNSSIAVPEVLRRMGLPEDSLVRLTRLESTPLYLAFSRGTAADTLAAWEQGLLSLQRDGTLSSLYKTWLPLEHPPTRIRLIGPPPSR